ncbi:MAG: hypothetical protein PVG07_08220 [Acidobacteriota bacterium]
MKRPENDLYSAWIEAEERGEADAADAALASLFRELPAEAPTAGFAERTMMRALDAGVLAERPVADVAPERRPLSVAARLAAVWLALMSLGTLLGASYLVTALPRLDLGVGVRGFTRLLAEAWQWLASGVVFWERLAELGGLVSKVLLVPEVSAMLFASLALAAVAFRLLQAILEDERKWTHVQQRH